MSQDEAEAARAAQRAAMAKKTIVYRVPGMDAVSVRRDIAYGTAASGPLTLDLYAPDDRPGERRPVVLFVYGFMHPAFASGLKHMGAYTSWGRLLAASGLAAVTYSYADPVADLQAVLRHLREHADELGVDPTRIAVWAGSGNVPMALSALMTPGDAFRCAVLCYGYMLDLAGGTQVAAAAAQFGCVIPAAGKTVEDLPALPLYVARAGKDQTAGLNETIDRFVAQAVALDRPITLVNHAGAPHAFDLFDDREATREVIRDIVGFLRFHLLGAR
jgi:acetyl esterase/lipase